jgi:hypothetical protein
MTATTMPPHGAWTRSLAVVLAAVALRLPAARAEGPRDELLLKGTEEAVGGDFLEFKNGRVSFRPATGKEIRERIAMVDTLLLDPPAKVDSKFRGKKERRDLKLKGLRDSTFIFDENGRELQMAAGHVTYVRMGLDWDRAKLRMQTPGAKSAGSDVEVEDLVQAGRVTIVHFVPAGAAFDAAAKMASTRTGNYLEALRDKSRGKLAVVEVRLAAWDDPTARRCEIRSMPQFWFYNAAGKLAAKLVDRFTSADIDEALAAARR